MFVFVFAASLRSSNDHGCNLFALISAVFGFEGMGLDFEGAFVEEECVYRRVEVEVEVEERGYLSC